MSEGQVGVVVVLISTREQAARCRADGQPAMASGSAEPAAALPKSRIGSGGLDKVRYLAASDTNEHGATGMKSASYGSKRGDGYYPIFMHSLFAGLVPSFSDFLEVILETYQIQLLHLHPNSILILSISAYLCEAYIGIRPYVELFRNFYEIGRASCRERVYVLV